MFFISGCQKDEIVINNQNASMQQFKLQLLESNNPIVEDVMGVELSMIKTKSVNNDVSWENPWLLKYDMKERIAFYVKTDNPFEDKRLIYVKNGEKHSSYYIERIYLGNQIKLNEVPAAEFILNFSGMLKVYNEKNTLVYILYYWDNKIIKTVDIVQETNRFRTTKSNDPNILSVALDEVVIVAEDLSHGGGSVWTTIPNYTTPNSTIESGSNNSGATNNNSFSSGSNENYTANQGIGEYGNEKTMEQIAREQIDYLKKFGEPELAAVFESLLSDKTLPMSKVYTIYMIIDSSCLELQAKFAIAIFGSFAEIFKPLIEIALFDIGGEVFYKLLKFLPKAMKESTALVWNSLSNTTECYEFSRIPKTFVFTTKNGKKFYVPISGTKHLDQILKKNGALNHQWYAESVGVRSQFILGDFAEAVNHIYSKHGKYIIYEHHYYSGGWDIMFNVSNSGGYPVIFHAVKLR